jgi:hypothetical protein
MGRVTLGRRSREFYAAYAQGEAGPHSPSCSITTISERDLLKGPKDRLGAKAGGKLRGLRADDSTAMSSAEVDQSRHVLQHYDAEIRRAEHQEGLRRFRWKPPYFQTSVAPRVLRTPRASCRWPLPGAVRTRNALSATNTAILYRAMQRRCSVPSASLSRRGGDLSVPQRSSSQSLTLTGSS